MTVDRHTVLLVILEYLFPWPFVGDLKDASKTRYTRWIIAGRVACVHLVEADYAEAEQNE